MKERQRQSKDRDKDKDGERERETRKRKRTERERESESVGRASELWSEFVARRMLSDSTGWKKRTGLIRLAHRIARVHVLTSY